MRNAETLLLKPLPPGARIIRTRCARRREELERFVAMLRETTALVRRKKGGGPVTGGGEGRGPAGEVRSFGEGHVKTDRWLEMVYTGQEQGSRPDALDPFQG